MKEKEEVMRTHIVIPRHLVRTVDALVGRRKRSAFFEEAAREKVARMNLLRALDETARSIKAEDHPEWASSRDVAGWVSDLREKDRERLSKRE